MPTDVLTLQLHYVYKGMLQQYHVLTACSELAQTSIACERGSCQAAMHTFVANEHNCDKHTLHGLCAVQAVRFAKKVKLLMMLGPVTKSAPT